MSFDSDDSDRYDDLEEVSDISDDEYREKDDYDETLNIYMGGTYNTMSHTSTIGTASVLIPKGAMLKTTEQRYEDTFRRVLSDIGSSIVPKNGLDELIKTLSHIPFLDLKNPHGLLFGFMSLSSDKKKIDDKILDKYAKHSAGKYQGLTKTDIIRYCRFMIKLFHPKTKLDLEEVRDSPSTSEESFTDDSKGEIFLDFDIDELEDIIEKDDLSVSESSKDIITIDDLE